MLAGRGFSSSEWFSLVTTMPRASEARLAGGWGLKVSPAQPFSFSPQLYVLIMSYISKPQLPASLTSGYFCNKVHHKPQPPANLASAPVWQ